MENILMVEMTTNVRVDINCQEVYSNILNKRLEYHGQNFEYIGAGASRKVFRYGNIVFKLAKNGFGIAQNEAEVKLFYSISEDLKDLICPILWYSDDFKVVICKYAEPLYRPNGWNGDTIDSINDADYINKVNYYSLHDKLCRLRNNYDVDFHDMLKVSSWGNLDGKMVIVDYGYTGKVRSCNFGVEYFRRVLDI